MACFVFNDGISSKSTWMEITNERKEKWMGTDVTNWCSGAPRTWAANARKARETRITNTIETRSADGSLTSRRNWVAHRALGVSGNDSSPRRWRMSFIKCNRNELLVSEILKKTQTLLICSSWLPSALGAGPASVRGVGTLVKPWLVTIPRWVWLNKSTAQRKSIWKRWDS